MKDFCVRKVVGKKLACGVLMVAGILGAVVREARATVTLQETVVPIDPELEAAGWMGIELTLLADKGSVVVSGMDLKNRAIYNEFNPAGPSNDVIGISGPIHQGWSVTKKGVVQTPTGDFDDSGAATDSYFLNTTQYDAVPDPFTEDNNLSSGGLNGNFASSPLVNGVDDDGNNVEYGVGSLMTEAGTVQLAEKRASFDVAFLIVPAGMGNVYLRGVATDWNVDVWEFDAILNPAGLAEEGGSSLLTPGILGGQPSNVPEAGTIGVGVVMAGMVLKKRRRKGKD